MLERELRDLAYIKRWAICRTVRQQSVAEHSYYVAMYTNDLCQLMSVPDNIRLSAIQKALWDDVEEIITGDIPGPHKKHIVDKPKYDVYIEKSMDRMFTERSQRAGSLFLLLQTEKLTVSFITKIADYMEALHFLEEEECLGNKTNTDLKGGLWEMVESLVEDLSKVISIESPRVMTWLKDRTVRHTSYYASDAPRLARYGA